MTRGLTKLARAATDGSDGATPEVEGDGELQHVLALVEEHFIQQATLPARTNIPDRLHPI